MKTQNKTDGKTSTESIGVTEMLKNLVRVSNMTSNNGNEIPNQFIIKGNNWTLFQSYKSPIALEKDGKVYLFEDWDYSKTTGKYRNLFLGETKKETEDKIKSGQYILVKEAA